MSGHRSFKDVIESDYYNAIFDALSDQIECCPDRLDLFTRRVESPEYAELSDIDIKAVYVCDKGGLAIEFDVIVSAEITVSKHYGSDVETDEAEQWFSLTCSGELEDGLQKFKIGGISPYSRVRFEKEGRLTDTFVPVISKDSLDDEATAFLEAYYPDALKEPMALPVREVAAHMGLTIRDASLSQYFTIFGMMVFGDSSALCFDHDAQSYKEMDVKRGTILVDPDVFFLRNLGCWNNTVIHECFHWHRHRKHYELTKMYKPDDALITCRVDEKARPKPAERKWRDCDWIEWQANSVAPRILMPKDMTLVKIDEFRQGYEQAHPLATFLEVTGHIISGLADFFGVSRASAKIRMLDLGFPEAAGLYVYVDDHYVSPFALSSEAATDGRSYSIGIREGFSEYLLNPGFRQYIDSGGFIYIDGHYVIDDPTYVSRTPACEPCLTDYARSHADECCLGFSLVPDETAMPDVGTYLETGAFRKAVPPYRRRPEFSDDERNRIVLSRSEELRQMRTELDEEDAEYADKGLSFSRLVREHMKRKNVRYRSDFTGRTLLSEKTAQRIVNDDSFKPGLDTVMAVAVGLDLGFTASESLFASAGFALEGPVRNRVFRKILLSFHGHDIFSCNEALDALGEPPIGEATFRDIVGKKK
jgi:hypothetical protein